VKFLFAIFPTAGVLFIFWLAIRAIFQADRNERAAEAKFDAENAARAAREQNRVDREQNLEPDAGDQL
jgi:threonine/homoserine/homoserine lactone efflux protein